MRDPVASPVPGFWVGRIHFAPDWDSPEVNAAIAADFEASEIFPQDADES